MSQNRRFHGFLNLDRAASVASELTHGLTIPKIFGNYSKNVSHREKLCDNHFAERRGTHAKDKRNAENGSGGMSQIEQVMMTPEKAEGILKGNTNNRKMRAEHVEFLTKEMASGNWHPGSNDMIVVATDGTLLNGQHRLTAVVKSGASVVLTVMWGASHDSYSIMDKGMKRKPSDFFRHNGTPYANSIPVVAGFILSNRGGLELGVRNHVGYSAQELWDEFTQNEQTYLSSLTFAARLGPGVLATTAATAFVNILANTKYPEKLDEFAHIASPAYRGDAPSNHAARAMTAHFLNLRISRAKRTPQEYITLIIKAWNAYVQGKTIGNMKLGAKEIAPEVL